MKKDPGIPNLFPYKEKILQEIEEKKRLKAEEAAREKAEVRGEADGSEIDDAVMDENDDRPEYSRESEAEDEDMNESVDPMAALLASARARAAEFEKDQHEQGEEDMVEDGEEWDGFDDDEDGGVRLPAARTKPDTSRKAYDKIFREVVELADVILYVLDARDPEGTRSKEVERQILSAAGGNKRLILILNKVDLVPPPVLKGWLAYLRRYFPTLPLRASTPAPNARTFDHKHLTVKATSEALFKALKSYAQSKSLKRSVSVGVIGYPNVGKSSAVNALTSRLGGRSTSCPTGAEPGVTTSLREVKLDNKLKLLDSPGIVFPSSSAKSTAKIDEQARLILLNAVPPKEIDDAIPAITMLLKRVAASEDMMQKLLSVYSVPPILSRDGDMTTSFLVEVARKRGRLGKGGVPNLQAAAMTVITDWRDGRIQGWMEPPTAQIAKVAESDQNGDGSEMIGADHKIVVKEWAAEFKLEGLWGDGGTDGGDKMAVES